MKQKLLNKFAHSTIGRALRILSTKDRLKVIHIVLIQVSLGVLDLLGIAVIGILSALAITGIGSNKPGDRVLIALRLLHLENLTLQSQVSILGCLGAALLIVKTIISVVLTRKITFYLSRRGAIISSQLTAKVLSQSLIEIQATSLQQTLYLTTTGVDIITMGILNVLVLLISDTSLLLILSIGLFVVDPAIAFSSFLVFSLVAFALYKLLAVRSRNLGMMQTKFLIENSERTIEVLTSYRELVVRNRRSYYAREIGKIRLNLANTLAEKSFMPYIGKYVIEITLVIGSLSIAAIQFMVNDAAHAVAVLSVFLVASSRISPAVLRMQQSSLAIKSSLGGAEPTLLLIEKLRNIIPIEDTDDRVHSDHLDFNGKITLDSVSLKYPEKEFFAIRGVSIGIKPGKVVALVGPSGAGKTSLVDLILGVINPNEGKITISEMSPIAAIQKWPGAIGYVPQNVTIINGSIRQNISMGFPPGSFDDKLVWDALKVASLDEFVMDLPEGLDSQTGDRGTQISGGQRQRLGIARAMFTKPKILVLDEATSALDGETESNISESIKLLKGGVTVIMIAHRLSTVKHCDEVVYMENGEIISAGTFDEVRKQVPNFDKQAKLMGL